MPGGNHSKGEDQPIGNVIRIGRYWAAVLMSDGSVLLQHLSQVCIGGSGQSVDLLNEPQHFDSIQYHLQDMDSDRVGVRTILLRQNGAIVTDPDAISPSGLLSEEAYEAIPPTRESAVRYFSRRSNKGDW